MAHSHNIAIIFNSRAGKGRAGRVLKQILQKLMHTNHAFSIMDSHSQENLDAFTSVWIIGGDGTLNYFINHHPAIQIPIALFKGGSGNDFAWKLYGNISVDDYFESVLNGIPRKVDAGICNGKYFLNGVGVGFDGEVVKARLARKVLPGRFGYLYTVLKKLFFFRESEIMIKAHDQSYCEKCFMLTVANGSRYGGGFLVAPRATINDGKLDVVLIKPIPRLMRFYYVPKVEKGKHLHFDFVLSCQTRKIIIQSSKLITGHLDGEIMEANEFNIEILPNKYWFYY